MSYEAELNFLRNILKHYRLQTLLISLGSVDAFQFDMGLRQLIGINYRRDNLFDFLNNHNKNIKPKQIYKVRDSFHCIYFFILLPDSETVLSIGPYIEHSYSTPALMEQLERHSISPQLLHSFEKYFSNMPIISDDSHFLTLLHTFAETLWGNEYKYSLTNYNFEINDIAPSDFPDSDLSTQEDTLFQMQILEQRYETENELLHAISLGLADKAAIIAATMNSFMEKRSNDQLRNNKNYAIISNTLLRKAVQSSMVHPYYIDKVSSHFARKIENCLSVEACTKLQNEMIRKYALLVKNHSMKGYSPLIQQVIMRIDSDLTQNLSLSAIADMVSINASYLSAQFKKETGTTLTEYVNKKRVEHALLLLNSTSMQIQTIAQYCGITDVNYFTKLFKKYINKTPKDYRDDITRS